MDYLAKPLRRTLESTVVEARDVAELAATAVLKHLGVGEPKAPRHLSPDQQALRRRLRAHGRQLGDHRKPDGKQSIAHLVQETAYEHWHRMLFARFLAENHLLMHPDGVALTLDECEELAPDEGAANGWELAGRYASRMLPQIFRTDSPVLALSLAPEHQRKLERLLAGLDVETFRAADSLGWVYQFWQSKKKDEVNRSEVKIGADELPAVTQLFTEPYMVHFLLDNSLGAWWAARTLSEDDLKNASSEDELRKKASIPGVPLEYLRFVKQESGTWIPAGGTFDAWPDQLSDLKTLDPCCGSGHFLVAALLMLVPIRMATETLSAREAVDAVLRDNLHGLELDQRCVELAAFALAFTAWKFPNAGGYRLLPELSVACAGVSISAKKEDWLALSNGNTDLEIVLDELYEQFRFAPVLGSMINPERSLGKNTLFELEWEKVGPLLEKALQAEQDYEKSEMGIAAKGIAKAATLLNSNYRLIFTNPPYLVNGKQSNKLQDYLSSYYSAGDADIATVFLKRFDDFLVSDGVHCSVTPLNWYYLKSYDQLRRDLLSNSTVLNLTKVGSGATAKASWDVLRAVAIIAKGKQTEDYLVTGLEATESSEEDRSLELKNKELFVSTSEEIARQPDAKFAFGLSSEYKLLEEYAWSYQGPSTADYSLYGRKFWEIQRFGSDWVLQAGTFKSTAHFDGLDNLLLWEMGQGRLAQNPKAAIRGEGAHDKYGVVVTQTRMLPSTIYLGGFFDNNVAVLATENPDIAKAIWCYCSCADYNVDVRKLDEKLGVTNATLAKVPFNIEYWTKVAEEKYPNGLPKPYTDDPTQWIFHGHPCGSVIWDEAKKWTVHGSLRIDDTVLQVAIARLLGYRWPAELDANMELADEQREWVNRCQDLAAHIDDDGIVCIPTIRGEKPAAERLLSLLQAAYGEAWAAQTLSQILAESGAKGKNLEWWLREKFFEQHCKLFQHRPFIWHIWDGLKDGFGALVNYHQLDRKTLETLIYTYLGDWIGLQERAVNDGIDGAQIRLTAAQDLKRRLELILEGEQPYDIFVRWKPLEQQPIGWEPDLNDGVRLNIRPFVTAEVLRQNKKPKLNIHWNKDRGKDVESAPWFRLGLEHDGKEGDRLNDHHLTLTEKRKAGGR